MDHIHIANQAIQKSAEYPQPFYMAFIYYEKEFDFVLTAAVLEALKDQGIETTYVILLDDINKGCTGRITLHKQSDKLRILGIRYIEL